MSNIKPPQHGGARAGAGRPRGTVNKITGASILASHYEYFGIPLEDHLMQILSAAEQRADWATVRHLGTLLLNKTASDRHHVEMDHRADDTIEAKAAAFRAALDSITQLDNQKNRQEPVSPV
jgi:hypothetical protein